MPPKTKKPDSLVATGKNYIRKKERMPTYPLWMAVSDDFRRRILHLIYRLGTLTTSEISRLLSNDDKKVTDPIVNQALAVLLKSGLLEKQRSKNKKKALVDYWITPELRAFVGSVIALDYQLGNEAELKKDLPQEPEPETIAVLQ